MAERPQPFVQRLPGDYIVAEDFNEVQIRAKEEMRTLAAKVASLDKAMTAMAGTVEDIGNRLGSSRVVEITEELEQFERAKVQIKERLAALEAPASAPARDIGLDLRTSRRVRIYWTDNTADAVMGVDGNGANLETLVSTGPGQSGPAAIAAAGDAIYWGDLLKNTISRASVDGANAKTIVTGVDSPFGIALDMQAEKMYWTDQAARKIQRANLDGSAVEDVITNLGGGSGRGIIDLDIDSINGTIYWTELSNRVIQRANLDGSGLQTIVTEPSGSQPQGIVIDAGRGMVYWTDSTRRKIRVSDLDGGNIEDVVVMRDVGYVYRVSIDSSGQTLYFSSSTYNSQTRTNVYSILRANLDGTDIEVVVTGASEIGDIAVVVEMGGEPRTTSPN